MNTFISNGGSDTGNGNGDLFVAESRKVGTKVTRNNSTRIPSHPNILAANTSAAQY